MRGFFNIKNGYLKNFIMICLWNIWLCINLITLTTVSRMYKIYVYLFKTITKRTIFFLVFYISRRKKTKQKNSENGFFITRIFFSSRKWSNIKFTGGHPHKYWPWESEVISCKILCLTTTIIWREPIVLQNNWTVGEVNYMQKVT